MTHRRNDTDLLTLDAAAARRLLAGGSVRFHSMVPKGSVMRLLLPIERGVSIVQRPGDEPALAVIVEFPATCRSCHACDGTGSAWGRSARPPGSPDHDCIACNGRREVTAVDEDALDIHQRVLLEKYSKHTVTVSKQMLHEDTELI